MDKEFKPKKRLNKALIAVLILFLGVIALITYFMWSQRALWVSSIDKNGAPKDSSRYAPGPIDMSIVEELKPSESNPFQLPLMSWNDKLYGRIYASICTAPNAAMYACGGCVDGGVSFYDWQGKSITTCNSGWGQGGDECAYLKTLKYNDADYISKICKANISDTNTLRAIDIAEKYFFSVYPPQENYKASSIAPKVMAISPTNAQGNYTVSLKHEFTEKKLIVNIKNWQIQK